MNQSTFLCFAVLLLSAAGLADEVAPTRDGTGHDHVSKKDLRPAHCNEDRLTQGTSVEEDGTVAEKIQQTQQVQPQAPQLELRPVVPRASAAQPRFRSSTNIDLLTLSRDRQNRARLATANLLLRGESKTRPSSDVGSLLSRSRSILGVGTQKRTPIVTDTRPRGGHVGQALASGSFWIPARMDLDTMLSKIDSNIISDVIVIKGPYSTRYGPGFSFIDTQLLSSPRYPEGLRWHGRSSMNYQTNGRQWYARQTLMGGSSDWGVRVGYGHRTGNDYETGGGTDIPSSYKSRDIDSALGFDLSPDSYIEFSYLRLDQTDVEFPGQIFDMDFLVTDGYDVRYVTENQYYFDRLSLDAWYNRTRFEGNAQRSGKRRQIPELNCDPLAPVCFYAPRSPGGVLDFFGLTDADAMSSGFRLATSWGDPDCAEWTLGVDLRYLEQELNEVDLSPFIFTSPAGRNFNFPIPRSHSSNPGLFAENVYSFGDGLVLRSGARVDWVGTNARRFVPNTDIDQDGRQDDLQEILGAGFDQHFNLGSAFMTAEYEVDPHWTANGAVGYAMRPPTLTEQYSAQSFLAILQQGFTFVTGDPDLDAERLWQLDLGLKADYGRVRAGVSGFYGWIHDYITYEAEFRIAAGLLPNGLGVTFVNTDLATLSGGEVYGEYDWSECLTWFAHMSYVEGRDHSRDGRGVIPGSDEEPLPGIAPLESHLGFRFHEPTETPRWGIEVAARVVDNQDRVATSLEELPTAGFTTWNLRGYWQASDDLLLVAGIENFTDKQYREHLDLRTGNGVFQPGANFYFGMEMSY